MAKLADEIISNCNRIIHPSRVEEVEQLLIKLQKYVIKSETNGADSSSKESKGDREGGKSRNKEARGDRDREKDRELRKADKKNRDRDQREDKNGGRSGYDADNDYKIVPPPIILPPATMDDLDEYLDMLYQVPLYTLFSITYVIIIILTFVFTHLYIYLSILVSNIGTQYFIW